MHNFSDYGFKLVIIEALLENGSFLKELEELKSIPKIQERLNGDISYGEIIPEMDAFFRNLTLTNEDLDKVNELWFDPGADIYHLVQPFWSGYDEHFHILNVDGFEKLKNLKCVHQIAMISEEQFDRFRDAGIECD